MMPKEEINFNINLPKTSKIPHKISIPDEKTHDFFLNRLRNDMEDSFLESMDKFDKVYA